MTLEWADVEAAAEATRKLPGLLLSSVPQSRLLDRTVGSCGQLVTGHRYLGVSQTQWI